MARADVHGSGVYRTTGVPQQPHVLWRFPVGHGVIASTPAIAGGRVYFGDPEQGVYALDARSGQERWDFAADDFDAASPAIADGVVYATTRETVYALDGATGREQWEFSVADCALDYAGLANPIVVGGVVYVGGLKEAVYALDGQTGHERWRAAVTGGVPYSPAIANGLVYFGTDRLDWQNRNANPPRSFYALNRASGQVQWVLPVPGDVSASPTVVDGVVYFVSDEEILYAVDAQTGHVQWQSAIGGLDLAVAAVAYGTVYVTTGSGLHAVDRQTGVERWTFQQVDVASNRYAAAIADGIIYIPSTGRQWSFRGFEMAGYLYALDAQTGQEIWKYPLNNAVDVSPAIADGVIYLECERGYLCALR
ncbi:MAG TPA: PQQ-binding-like beta-propeller repeat protein [Chloroflexia bacterium]|nr:PQQ-binding-like beta-propeller repeat protein [Chloroflexia bacterium]